MRFFLYFCKPETKPRMKTTIIQAILFLLTLTACSGGGSTEEGTIVHTDTLHLLTTQIQQCSRLYTTEYHIHKIVACESNKRIQIPGFSFDLDFFGDRKVIIPIDATLKGYIDFSQFSESNVERQGDTISITLPDPQVMITSTRIDQEGIKEYVTGFRNQFTDKEMTAFEAQGRQAIIDDIPSMGIENAARFSAARILIPLISQMGFDEQNIFINFRHDYQPGELTRKLD